VRMLEANHQSDTAAPLYILLTRPADHFVKIAPVRH
jgi:hypothetical protein